MGAPHPEAEALIAAHTHARVFAAPPWHGIFTTHPERRHDFAAAEAEHHALGAVYRAAGYGWEIQPTLPVAEGADHLERALT